ncbi:MAG: anti-sigma factor family protein [Terriglobales bacterium]
MNCLQFENALSEYMDGDASSEQRAHLNSCSACSGLLADLSLISSEASSLRELDGPSDKVWGLLEAQLRQEGLIKQPARPSQPDFFHRWRTAWLVPVAAALLIAAGIKLYQPTKIGDNQPVAKQRTPSAPFAPVISAEDKDVMNTVASRPPAQVAAYRNDLAQANSFIRDAQEAVKNDPNDIYSQQMLMNAYEQKQMVYRLAVDQNNEDEQ